jgi:hypothetical protein
VPNPRKSAKSAQNHHNRDALQTRVDGGPPWLLAGESREILRDFGCGGWATKCGRYLRVLAVIDATQQAQQGGAADRKATPRPPQAE